MKKYIHYLALFVLGILSGCQKEYTCECYTIYQSSGFTGEVKVKSRKDGETACNSLTIPSPFHTNQTYWGTCILK